MGLQVNVLLPLVIALSLPLLSKQVFLAKIKSCDVSGGICVQEYLPIDIVFSGFAVLVLLT